MADHPGGQPKLCDTLNPGCWWRFARCWRAARWNPSPTKDSEGREVASLGGGILRKSKARNLSITKTDGTVIEADTTEEDEPARLPSG